MNYEKIQEHYREHEDEIEERLREFEETGESGDYRLFMELVFVILTSQSSAKNAWNATEELDDKNLLLEGNKQQISQILERNDISYEQNKSGYIVENRKMLSQPTLSNPTNELKLREKLDLDNPEKSRDWLAEDIKGISWKGASHFLRNIGHGEDLAIVSGHIIDQLNEQGVINSTEQPSSKEDYLDIEDKIKDMSEDIGIELEALDLVLWSMKTGEVFK